MRRDLLLNERCAARFARFVPECTSAITARLARDASEYSTSPFGQDPAFNVRSVLYSATAANNVSAYYNTSAGSGDISIVGFPKGFFPVPFEGFEPGFPLMLPVRIRFMHVHTLFACEVAVTHCLAGSAFHPWLRSHCGS